MSTEFETVGEAYTAVVEMGLIQFDDECLQRVIDWKGDMLLDGRIAHVNSDGEVLL